MGFSSILDISSFFIGMIINLIFVALMCYYFKRKYDYLYEAQCEQSKILYQLLHKPTTTSTSTYAVPSMDFTCDPLVKVSCSSGCLSEEESDSDSDSDSDGEIDIEKKDVIESVLFELNSSELRTIHLNPDDTNNVELKQVDLKQIDLNSSELKQNDLIPIIDLELDPMDHVTVEEVKLEEPVEFSVSIEIEPQETNYSKMSIKQLKEVLSSKGIKIKPNIKKDELIELITKDTSSSSS